MLLTLQGFCYAQGRSIQIGSVLDNQAEDIS
jgi:hypothetical protein